MENKIKNILYVVLSAFLGIMLVFGISLVAKLGTKTIVPYNEANSNKSISCTNGGKAVVILRNGQLDTIVIEGISGSTNVSCKY